MEQREDDNLSAVLEYPLDMERYIQRRLREIDDLDERRFAKTVLLEGLGKLVRCMEAKYEALEHRVYEEIEVKANHYETVITIIEKKDYDPLNDTLFPVCPEDLKEGYCEASNINKISEQSQGKDFSAEKNAAGGYLTQEPPRAKEVYAGTIFLEADETTAERFRKKGIFHGGAVFHVRPAQRYRDQLERLYHTFQDNHLPWETIHTGFLDKFFDVFMECSPQGEANISPPEPPKTAQVQTAQFPMGRLEKERAEAGRFRPDYGEFAPFVRYGMMPLWNIEEADFDSVDFMMPCIDGIYYEHEFTIEDSCGEDGYLIRSNEDILEIRHEDGKIIMKSPKEIFEGWQALHMVQKETVRSLNYTAPLLTNHKKGSFLGKFSGKTQIQLLTKTDLFRRIMELDTAEYIEVTGYEICDNVRDYPMREGMNWFVRDELFPIESRKVLLLKFIEKKPGHYLNDSMVRFAVSQIQLEISEYRCVGIILRQRRNPESESGT